MVQPDQAGRLDAELGSIKPIPPTTSVGRESLFLFVAQLVSRTGSFAGIVIIARGLGPDGRGKMAFLTVLMIVVAKICNVGISEATQVFCARDVPGRPKLLSNLICFSAGGAFILSTFIAT